MRVFPHDRSSRGREGPEPHFLQPCHLHVSMRVLSRKQICFCWRFTLGLPASRTGRNKYTYFLFKPPTLRFCYSSLSWIRQCTSSLCLYFCAGGWGPRGRIKKVKGCPNPRRQDLKPIIEHFLIIGCYAILLGYLKVLPFSYPSPCLL